MEENTLENLKMVNGTDKESKHGKMEQNTLEDLKMINGTDKELIYFLVEQNTLENLKMVNGTDKELTRGKMEQLKKASGKTEILLNEKVSRNNSSGLMFGLQ